MQVAVYTALLLSLVSSSLAYLVTHPGAGANDGWHAHEAGRVAWNHVDTNAKGFTIFLTNQVCNVLSQDIVIAEHVDSSTHSSIDIPAPHHGFPTGAHFRVNLVKNANDPQTIYAQSNEFTIRK
ncbi:hypothetical protein AN958_08991 [Leucoagaricus sp. SymC.cos]|nr:hypothetical protein AN958_08991 [Leucoagaricus sp. SymC.cos]